MGPFFSDKIYVTEKPGIATFSVCASSFNSGRNGPRMPSPGTDAGACGAIKIVPLVVRGVLGKWTVLKMKDSSKMRLVS